ncbi:MAG: hypothetical protein EXQ56_11795 [Acidobacteria bacterium]|nr:hypothetical protein [Acidobacteriota bacterium]
MTLEEKGIFGEGLLFSNQEKLSATETPQNVTNFFGTVINPQVQQGSQNPIQINEQSVDLQGIEALLKFVRAKENELPLNDEDRKELNAELSTLEAQVISPKPKSSIIRECLYSLRKIVESAGGAAAGHVLVELAKQLL